MSASRVTTLRFGALSVRVSDDPAGDAARSIAVRLRRAQRLRGTATLAVSGGSTAPPLLAALVHEDLDWDAVTIWQVDERVAPDGDDDRNAGQLWFVPAETVLMPVTDADLAGAADRYAVGLPERFDVVHLGLGDDGHTASWPPSPHPDADVVDARRRVAVVGEFNGRTRMTLTPPVVNGARSRVLLTVGASKAEMLQRFVARDVSLPVAHVRRSATTVCLDAEAAELLQGAAERH